MKKNDLQSRTIDMARLLLICMVVLVHSYTSTRSNIDTTHFPVYRFVSFLFSLNICQVAIPGFFFISGYLFFFSATTRDRGYIAKQHSIWPALLRPYLIWNTLILALYFCVEHIPPISGYLSGNNLPVSQYNFIDLLKSYWDMGNGTPILHQFWYIRNLIILGICSPLVFLFVRKLGLWGISLLLLWWIIHPGLGETPKSIAFFCLGAWISIRDRDFLPDFRRWAKPVALVYIVLVAVTMIWWEEPFSAYTNRIGNLVGVVFFINSTAWIVEKMHKHISFHPLQGITFFIFATHDPLIILVKRLMIKFVSANDVGLVVVYFIAPGLVIGICWSLYYLLKRIMPNTLSLLVGSRSFMSKPVNDIL